MCTGLRLTTRSGHQCFPKAATKFTLKADIRTSGGALAKVIIETSNKRVARSVGVSPIGAFRLIANGRCAVGYFGNMNCTCARSCQLAPLSGCTTL
jgi:hypothetical protein